VIDPYELEPGPVKARMINAAHSNSPVEVALGSHVEQCLFCNTSYRCTSRHEDRPDGCGVRRGKRCCPACRKKNMDGILALAEA